LTKKAHVLRRGSGWTTDREAEVAKAGRLARLAAEMGKDDAVALGSAAIDASHARSICRLIAQRVYGVRVSACRILSPSKLPVVTSWWIWVKSKGMVRTINSFYSPTLKHPEVCECAPACIMTGVDAKTHCNFRNSLGQLTLIGTQITKYDMRIGIVLS
jgi:hypothetical protein